MLLTKIHSQNENTQIKSIDKILDKIDEDFLALFIL